MHTQVTIIVKHSICLKGVRVDQAVRYLGRLRALRFECDNYNAATRPADAQHFGRNLERGAKYNRSDRLQRFKAAGASWNSAPLVARA